MQLMGKKTVLQISSQVVSTLFAIMMILFISAGSVNFCEAWYLLGIILLFAALFTIWLFIKYPGQIANRMQATEPDERQRHIVQYIGCDLCMSLIVAGLDKRFGLSQISEWRYVAVFALLIVAALIYRNVFAINPYLSNTIEIHEEHTVIQHGMYRIVRHPMYLASAIVYLSGLLILRSVWTIPFFVILICLLNRRAQIEEEQLMIYLPDYAQYMKRIKFRIIPFIV